MTPFSQCVQAEAPARECLAIREKRLPGGTRANHARSLLGAALLGQKRYAEAEPLLLRAADGAKQLGKTIPPDQFKQLLESLVHLYEAQGQTARATEWQRKLDEFQKVPPAGQP